MTTSIIPHQVPWTRLQGTSIFEAALHHQSSNSRRRYHNADHVLRLYAHAASTFKFPYSRALDLAILTHDVVFDCRTDREIRSVTWLEDHLEQGENDHDFDQARRYILATIDHVLTCKPEMVLLDLADFGDAKTSAQNTGLLRAEAKHLHGVNAQIFAMGCVDYLDGLYKRFKSGVQHLSKDHVELHAEICRGIFKTKSSLHDDCSPMEPPHV